MSPLAKLAAIVGVAVFVAGLFLLAFWWLGASHAKTEYNGPDEDDAL